MQANDSQSNQIHQILKDSTNLADYHLSRESLQQQNREDDNFSYQMNYELVKNESILTSQDKSNSHIENQTMISPLYNDQNSQQFVEKCLYFRPLPIIIKTNLSKFLHIFLVIDDGLLIKTQKEIILQAEDQPDSSKPVVREYLHWDYRVRGEYYYARPYFDELIKYLCTLDTQAEFQGKLDYKISLCLNSERKRVIGLAFQMFQAKKLREFKSRILSIHDDLEFDLKTQKFIFPYTIQQSQKSEQECSQVKKLVISSNELQSDVKISKLTQESLIGNLSRISDRDFYQEMYEIKQQIIQLLYQSFQE
ncbi:UNKNOWN [Stylonychia lemnae]|uniref:Uncharacterized protein n=1 Tax=Stylonychia lemnae TaxID=5949 RepID=A0A077ZUB3_STYLE|nr:UNKNOWN [Stylonychia lemnae]|eukprot:CDW73462.1 UNKNOWN [Stylonychia lemnae]